MTLKLNGTTSGSVSLDAPATGSDVSLTLPGSVGTSGQLLSTNGAGVLSFVNGGKILQVVSATSSTEVSTTSTTYVTAGLSASITPASTSNKVLVIATTNAFHNNTTNHINFTLFRGTVSGTNLGNGNIGLVWVYSFGGFSYMPTTVTYLDSPNTASSQTYTLGIRTNGAATTATAQKDGATGSIILLEVAA